MTQQYSERLNKRDHWPPGICYPPGEGKRIWPLNNTNTYTQIHIIKSHNLTRMLNM